MIDEAPASDPEDPMATDKDSQDEDSPHDIDSIVRTLENFTFDVFDISSDDDDVDDFLIHSVAISSPDSYRLFIRPILMNNILVKAHWDFGCNCSLIPSALLPHFNPAPDLQDIHKRVLSAVGASLTKGVVHLKVQLSPTCVTLAPFMVVDNLHMVLLGGDILGTAFKAHYDSDKAIMTLTNSHGRLEDIRLDYALPFPQSVIDLAVHCSCDEQDCTCSSQIPYAHHVFVKPEDWSPLASPTHLTELQKLLDEYSDVFIVGKSHNDKPPCPPARDYDFTVKLKDMSRREKYRVPHDPKDVYQNEFFKHWEHEMVNSGAAEGALWKGAIELYTGDVNDLPTIARARAIDKGDQINTYTGHPSTWDKRVIIDYREVNSNTIQVARFPAPSINSVLHHLTNFRVLSKVDIRHGFYNLAIKDEQTRRAFAFFTPHGVYLPCVMPMGAKEAPDYLML